MRRHLVLSVFIALMAALPVMPAAAAPVGFDPGVVLQSKAAKEQAKRDAEAKKDALNRCKQGWASLAGAESPHEAFTSRDACVSYVKGGGSLVAYTPLPPAAAVTFRFQQRYYCWADVALTNLDPGQVYTVHHYLNGGQGGIDQNLRVVPILPEPDGTVAYTAFPVLMGNSFEVRLHDAGGTQIAAASGTSACSAP